jgi:hypothetical protein
VRSEARERLDVLRGFEQRAHDDLVVTLLGEEEDEEPCKPALDGDEL